MTRVRHGTEMMKRHERRILRIICTGVFLFLSACGQPAEEPANEPEASAETETAPEELFEYTFNPHVISEEYCTVYGDGIEEEFFAFCDAILNNEKTVPCSTPERFHQLLLISNSCFPLAQELIDRNQTTVNDGVCHLAFRYDEEETDRIIAAFKEKVTDIITSAVPYEEPDFVKAMELFTAVSKKDRYDESYTLEDSLNLRSYRAVMTDTGICQEIAAEYIYYLLQTGINAIPCSSLNKDQSEAHEWAAVKLDGKYYHMDPTQAVVYPGSLYFFGMDDVQREYYGDFPPEHYTYAESDKLKEITANDRTFEKYWLAETYEIDHINRTIMITEINTGNRQEYGY